MICISLRNWITYEFSPDQRLVHLWTLGSAERDAFLANEAAKKWTSSNRVLVEIACARSSEQLFAARRAYHVLYKKSIEEDVALRTTGDFRKVLILEPNLVISLNQHFWLLFCCYEWDDFALFSPSSWFSVGC